MSTITYTFHYTYIIINTTNQMKYIGVRSCNCLPENDSDYMGSSKILIEALQKTPEAFTKIITDTFPTREIANANEQWLHETYDVARNPEFYNLCIAPKKFNMCGRIQTVETRKKISEGNKGKKLSEETRKKIIKNHVGMAGKKHSDATRKKQSESAKGRPRTTETRKKLSEAHKGRKPSEEARKKMSDAQKGRKHSEETKKKMSLAQSGEKHSQYGKVPWNKGKQHSAASRKKMSEAQSGEKHHMYGKKHSVAALENMRKTRGPQKKTTCPHCLQTGGGSMMKRHHFNNCKEIST